jgi:hypothetical protein
VHGPSVHQGTTNCQSPPDFDNASSTNYLGKQCVGDYTAALG